jgi:hypothetical protein
VVKSGIPLSRRHALALLGGAGALATSSRSWAQTPATPQILMDGHVHITNRVYWEHIDPWLPNTSDAGWDYGRARAAGVNCIIDNLGTLWGLELQLHAQADATADRDGFALRRAAFRQDGDSAQHGRCTANRRQRADGRVPRQRIGLGP